ncbi:type II secretion system F family protein [Microvirga massiliensis]|uniref:type II secretion system F family protein n=1 Tax=Microvirga massiliensis TaxID=1033741 RepID=UPI00062B6C86|nr:type II secretion system F family protein [Microvirga massiliensis]
MSIESWVLYSLVFAAVFLVAQFGYLYFFRELKPRRRINKRLAAIESGAYRTNEVVDVLKHDLAGLPDFLRPFGRLIIQAGHGSSLRKLAFGYAGTFAVLLLILSFKLQFVLAIPAAAGSSALLLYLFLKRARGKRLQKFAEQLPDVIDVIVRSLKAGHPFTVSLGLVAREMPDPSGTEFGLVSDEIAYGRDIQTALSNLYDRVGLEDLRFLTTSVTVQSQTGGNLAEILARLSKLMRDRFKMRRRVRALTAEGRFSALALTALPAVILGMMNVIAPAVYGSVWGNQTWTYMLVVAGGLIALGNVVMWKMVNFKV